MFNQNATLSGFNLSQLLPPTPDRTDLVSYTLKIGGNTIPDVVAVKSITVTYSANKIPVAQVMILDGDVSTQRFDSSDLDIFSPGSEIEILAGYHGDEKTIFKGIIVKHTLRIPENSQPHLEITCKDKAVKLTAGRNNRYFFNQTDSEIISSILRGKVQADVEDTNTQHKEMVQYYSSNWDFVVTRAEANGMLVLTKQGLVAVKKPDFGQESKFTLNYGTSILEFEAEMDARDQYPDAEAVSWNPADQSRQTATPGGSGGGGGFGGFSLPSLPNSPLGNAVGNVISGTLGISLPTAPPNTDYTRVMGLDHYPLQHTGAFTTEETQAWAGAQMTKSQLAKKQGRVKFDGVADIYPGDCIDLVGVGQRHSGKVYITGVLHDVSDGTWCTHAQFGMSQEWHIDRYEDVTAPPASSLLPAIHGLQIGTVTGLEDEDNAFRIQVRLPLIDASGRGVWTRLAAQDAGNNRGTCWRPEIGDEVIVGFLNNDPRQGIVLGALHSQANPAPIAPSDDNHEKGWVTRSDMRLIFNDDKKSFNLTTPAGKKVQVDEDADKIHLEDEHGNKITLSGSGIVIESASDLTLKAAQKITVEGMEIAQKAQTSFKAEAQSQAEVKTTGELVLKGTFVRIN